MKQIYFSMNYFTNFSPLSQFETLFATSWWDHIFLMQKDDSFSPFWLEEVSIFTFIFNSLIYTLLGAILFSALLALLFRETGHLIPQTPEEMMRYYLFSATDSFISANNSLGFQVYYVFYTELIISIFYYNFSGLIPFGFTLTSHLYVAFSISFSIFFGLNFIGISRKGWEFLGNFLPEGTLFELMGLIVFLEILSYLSRLFSLSIRLFANMMAGHAMLKIFASFIYSAILSGGVSFIVALLGINGLFAIIIIEIAVAALQLYVFMTLVFIYMKEGIKGTHLL